MLKAGALTQIRHRAAIGKGLLTQRLQTLAAGLARFVTTVNLGAFDHQHSGRAGRRGAGNSGVEGAPRSPLKTTRRVPVGVGASIST